MKRTLLAILILALISSPCLSQEIDAIKSIEGTVWSYKHYEPYFGSWFTRYISFHDGLCYEVYISHYECFNPDISGSVEYIDLPGISLFWYKDYCLVGTILPKCQWRTGVLFPLIGLGIQSCIGIPCPFDEGHTLKLISDMSLPEDFCSPGIWHISFWWGEPGTTLTDVKLRGIKTTFQDDPPVEVSFDPPDGLTVYSITVISNTEIEFNLDIAVDAPEGYRTVIVTYDNGNKFVELENAFNVY